VLGADCKCRGLFAHDGSKACLDRDLALAKQEDFTQAIYIWASQTREFICCVFSILFKWAKKG